jgi:hypothetical protein
MTRRWIHPLTMNIPAEYFSFRPTSSEGGVFFADIRLLENSAVCRPVN